MLSIATAQKPYAMPCIKPDDVVSMCNAACRSDPCVKIYCDAVDGRGCCISIKAVCESAPKTSTSFDQ